MRFAITLEVRSNLMALQAASTPALLRAYGTRLASAHHHRRAPCPAVPALIQSGCCKEQLLQPAAVSRCCSTSQTIRYHHATGFASTRTGVGTVSMLKYQKTSKCTSLLHMCIFTHACQACDDTLLLPWCLPGCQRPLEADSDNVVENCVSKPFVPALPLRMDCSTGLSVTMSLA